MSRRRVAPALANPALEATIAAPRNFYDQYAFKHGGTDTHDHLNAAKIYQIQRITTALGVHAESNASNATQLEDIRNFANDLLALINSDNSTNDQDSEIAGTLIVASTHDNIVGKALISCDDNISAFQAYSNHAHEAATEQARAAAEAEQARLAAETEQARLAAEKSVALALKLSDPETVDPTSLERLVGPVASGAIVEVDDNTQVTEAMLDPLILNNSSGSVFDKEAHNQWVGTQTTVPEEERLDVLRGPVVTTEVYIALDGTDLSRTVINMVSLSAENVNLEILSNALKLQQPSMVTLDAKWKSGDGLKAIVQLKSAYLQAAHIAQLNAIDPAMLSASNIATLNEQAAVAGFDAGTVLTAFSTPAPARAAAAETDSDSDSSADDARPVRRHTAAQPQRRRRNATAGSSSSVSAARILSERGAPVMRARPPRGATSSTDTTEPEVGTGSLQNNNRH